MSGGAAIEGSIQSRWRKRGVYSCRRESAWNLPVDIDYQTYPAQEPLRGDSEPVELVFLAMLTCCSPFGGYY